MTEDRRAPERQAPRLNGRRATDPRITDPATHPTRYVSLTVAAVYLECHLSTLHKWLDAGLLAYSQRGKRRKIAVRELVAFEARQQRRVS